MIVNIAIHIPDQLPNTREAFCITDTIEHHLNGKLNSLMQRLAVDHHEAGGYWWIDVVDGETRYKPENVSDLS